MWDSIRHHLGVGLHSMRMSFQVTLEYPVGYIAWFIMIPAQYFLGIGMLQVMVRSFDSVGGWTFPQLAFLYGLSLLSHGLLVALFIPTWLVERYLVEGAFDRMKLRPLNVYFQFLVRYFNVLGVIDLIPGVTIFVYALAKSGLAWSWENVIALPLVVAGGTLLRAGLYTGVSSIAFWTQRSFSLVGITEHLMRTGTFYPLNIYPLWFGWVLTVLFPVAWIAYFPTKTFLGLDGGLRFPLGAALVTMGIGLCVFAAGIAIFTLGLRRNNSSGS